MHSDREVHDSNFGSAKLFFGLDFSNFLSLRKIRGCFFTVSLQGEGGPREELGNTFFSISVVLSTLPLLGGLTLSGYHRPGLITTNACAQP